MKLCLKRNTDVIFKYGLSYRSIESNSAFLSFSMIFIVVYMGTKPVLKKKKYPLSKQCWDILFGIVSNELVHDISCHIQKSTQKR
jgi:thiamine pyrophosphokinase